MRSLRSRFEVGVPRRRVRAARLAARQRASFRRAPRDARARIDDARSQSRLDAWTRAPANAALHGDFATTPRRWVVDWLAALRHSGHVVTWSGSPPALALAAEALADPGGGARIDVAAPAGATRRASRRRERDRQRAASPDSARASSTPVVVGRVVARAGEQSASVAAPDSRRRARRSSCRRRRLGREVHRRRARGTRMAGDRAVLRRAERRCRAEALLRLDTARVAAVIAIDTSLSRSATRSSDSCDRAAGSFSRDRRAHRAARVDRARLSGARDSPAVLHARHDRTRLDRVSIPCDSQARTPSRSSDAPTGSRLPRGASAPDACCSSDMTTAGAGAWPARRAQSARIASGGRASSAPSPTLRVPPATLRRRGGESAPLAALVDRARAARSEPQHSRLESRTDRSARAPRGAS